MSKGRIDPAEPLIRHPSSAARTPNTKVICSILEELRRLT
jgi:hypothetical protein